MNNTSAIDRRVLVRLALGVCAAAAAWVVAPRAAEASGTMIISREVPPRTAYRQGDPGPVRSSIDVGPDALVRGAVGLNQHEGGHVGRELSDGEVAAITTGERSLGAAQGLPVSALSGNSAASAHLRNGQSSAHRSSHTMLDNIPQAVRGGGDRVVDTTRAMSDTLNRAFSGMR